MRVQVLRIIQSAASAIVVDEKLLQEGNNGGRKQTLYEGIDLNSESEYGQWVYLYLKGDV